MKVKLLRILLMFISSYVVLCIIYLLVFAVFFLVGVISIVDFLLKTRGHLKVASKRVWVTGKSFIMESRGFLISCNIYNIQLKKCIPSCALFAIMAFVLQFSLNLVLRETLLDLRTEWHAVASWTWDAQDETCGICRMAFDGCCPDCKLPGDDCPLIWGACNHAFHLHCILKWVTSQTPQAHCPMCRREWQFKGGDQTD
ncbi:uncharacterized protein LOC131307068 [Rhododendron vialii]|nr:uncharacterized protein LOC131307068 [Rhododendron vialii]